MPRESRISSRTPAPVAAALLAVLAGAGAPLGAQQPAAPGCIGSGGGGSSLGGTDVVYAIESDESGTRLQAAMLARGPAWWRRQVPPSGPRRPAPGPGSLSGAAVGPIWLLYDATARTVWVGDRPVPLGDANVLLVEADSATGAVRVVGAARVDPALPPAPGMCGASDGRAEAEAFDRALLATLARDSAVRAFARR